MEIINLTHQQPSSINKTTSFALNLKYLKEIWIFNCCQGCQNMLGKKHIKISQISKVIITELNITNISGLIGLLSSLSLINRTKELHIYSPKGLEKYLELGKKYSQTNFRYSLYLHILTTGIIINHSIYQVYTFATSLQFNFLIIFQEKYGRFKSRKAEDFNLISGPLYGQLKKGSIFLLPDGLTIKSNDFTQQNLPGKKITYIINHYCHRNSSEIMIKAKIIQNAI